MRLGIHHRNRQSIDVNHLLRRWLLVYDPVTLDQLRAFVTVVEEGSFSAAARKLERVQSAIALLARHRRASGEMCLRDRVAVR
jgi:Bacterial regulatory helix-turn-helix protein, lysR family